MPSADEQVLIGVRTEAIAIRQMLAYIVNWRADRRHSRKEYNVCFYEECVVCDYTPQECPRQKSVYRNNGEPRIYRR